MKIFIIGGTGHVGSYMVPKLVAEGHEVYLGTRGNTKVRGYSSTEGVQFVTVDSTSRESLAELLPYNFDVVIDMPGSAYNAWCVFSDSVKHIIACGSVWMYGNPAVVPTPEVGQSECPFLGYARRFESIKKMCAESGKDGKALFTAIMPPNICGPGKAPLECMGGRSLEVHKAHRAGKPVILPDGPECIISPCHAEDIADLFILALNNPEAAAGEIFNAGAEYGLTSSGLVKAFSDIYGVEIPIERVSWEKYTTEINPEIGAWWHFYAHMLPDITKAKEKLGYKPKYTPEEALRTAVQWMIDEGMI